MKIRLIIIYFIFPFATIAQKIDFALIAGNTFYYSEVAKEVDKTDKLYTHHLFDDKQIVNYVAVTRNSYNPNCWNKNKQGNFIYISGFGSERHGGKVVLTLKTIKFEKDGLSRILFSEYDSLKTVLGERRALSRYFKFIDETTNKRAFLPLRDWLKLSSQLDIQDELDYIFPYIAYDIQHLEDSVYHVYIRNKKELTVWQYTYPDYGNSSSSDHWTDLVTYSVDSTNYMPTATFKRRGGGIPNIKNYNYESITDTDFFEGDFKVIKQKNNTFCINIHNGSIYYIGSTFIKKVGSVVLNNYPTFLMGRPLFIENRDTEEIIFFSNVERLNRELPFPNIKQINKRKEINQLYPSLSDL
ncbi:MAG: hypothetical protein MI974_13860 [Chitinophagales bacterium]|nr:hypothetical protein [Chitinophagales bacterium]